MQKIKKNFLPIFILITLFGSFATTTNAQTVPGACRWARDISAAGIDHKKDELITPPLTRPDCLGDTTNYYWDQTAPSPTPPTPTPAPSPSPTPNNPPAKDLTYKLLAPLPCEKGVDPGCTGEKGLETFDPRSKDNLSNYLNLMIKIFIGICAVLAVVMIVIGGLEYMTSELISSKEEGKKRITEALLGLLLALGAIPLLNTINPDLLKSDLKIDTATVEVDLTADTPQTYDPITRKYSNGTLFGARWDDSVAPIATSSEPWWQYISINTSQCTTVGQPGCTSTRGLDVSYLKTIQWGCKCNLQITGGTESWLHGGKTGSTSHHIGSSTVDLRITQELTTYIVNGKPIVNWQRYERDGISFLKEPDHWHAGP